MEMRRQPRSVVNDIIEVVGGINDSGHAAEDENEKTAEEIRKEPVLGAKIREFVPPADQATSAVLSGAVFHRCSHGERGGKTRNRHQHGEKSVHKFPGGTDPRLGELMMN